jgi:hypothetical protein
VAVIEINRNPTRRQLNQFGLIWLAFVNVFGALAWVKDHHQLAVELWVVAVVVPVVGWLAPAFMRVVFVGMSYAAFPIGFVVSHVILAIVYYLVLTPIGLVMRLSGRDPMARRFDPAAQSYWIQRDSGRSEAGRYFRQF